jgi:hypothetical protein
MKPPKKPAAKAKPPAAAVVKPKAAAKKTAAKKPKIFADPSKPRIGNRLHTGATMSRLTLGNLPHCLWRVSNEARVYRRDLEALVVEDRGCISAEDAHLVDEASSATTHAGVMRWLMRERIDKMSVADLSKCSEGIMKAKRLRNAAIRALKLSRDKTQDIILGLYGKDTA